MSNVLPVRTLGTGWAEFGPDYPNNAVRTMLPAGGSFGNSGSTIAANVARWDGLQWRPFGTGTDGGIIGLASVGGDLIACGDFDYAPATLTNNIARWDGTSWYAMGDSFRNGGVVTNVTDLEIYNGDLIAGRKFQLTGATAVNNIARWDGSAWHPLASGVGDDPSADFMGDMTVYNGDLIVAGTFKAAGGKSLSLPRPVGRLV